jgi:hypothetical protein
LLVGVVGDGRRRHLLAAGLAISWIGWFSNGDHDNGPGRNDT